ncbi:hypothetical protein [Algivirga pacifica]|uniref:Nitrogen regulatory IIA protein n=1 Tax=Algivirga pacifica TaxID=1162670 RepID=A0ABP9D3T8_9BACT
MKKKYDYRFNRPTPSDKEIQKHMDFDALLQQHQKKQPKEVSFRPALKYVYWAAAAVLLLFNGIYLYKEYQEEQMRQERFAMIGLEEPLVTLSSLEEDTI